MFFISKLKEENKYNNKITMENTNNQSLKDIKAILEKARIERETTYATINEIVDLLSSKELTVGNALYALEAATQRVKDSATNKIFFKIDEILSVDPDINKNRL